MQTIRIGDVTLREAQKDAGAALSFKESLEIAKALARLRPFSLELPALKNGKADALLVKSIAAAVPESRLTLPAALTEESVSEAAAALSGARNACIQIAAPLSTVGMEYHCHKKPDAMLKLIGERIAQARALGFDAEFSAGDATRAETAFLERAVEQAVAAGAGTVTLCDTAGAMLPDEFAAFVEQLIARVPALAGITLGVECADALHLSAACSVAGCRAGASLVKAASTACGVLGLSSFTEILRARGMDLGLSAQLRTTELSRVEKQIDWVLHARRDAATPYEGGSRRREDGSVRLCVSSTRGEVAETVKRLGYDLSEEDNAKVYEAFRLIAAKKDVGEKELDAIVASAALQAPPAYTLESYVINSGNVITATAHIKLERDGKTLQGIGLGDGPIDASFLAIEQIIGHHYELDDFQIQAVTEGREAMGSALVRLRSNGRLYAGKGISTDIIGASIRAYVSALNKIVHEESRT